VSGLSSIVAYTYTVDDQFLVLSVYTKGFLVYIVFLVLASDFIYFKRWYLKLFTKFLPFDRQLVDRSSSLMLF